MPCRTGVSGWRTVIGDCAHDRHPTDHVGVQSDGIMQRARERGRLDAALLNAYARRQALEQHVGPEAVEPRRAAAGAEAILVGWLHQTAALDQAAKILLVQMRA